MGLTQHLRLLFCTTLASACAFSQIAHAQELSQTDEQFREVFITAGYSAAFGAATGAAILAFIPRPEDNLRLVIGGASAGFVAGSAYALYRLTRDASARSMYSNDDYMSLPPSPPSAQNDFPSGALILGRKSSFAFSIPEMGYDGTQYHMALARLKF